MEKSLIIFFALLAGINPLIVLWLKLFFEMKKDERERDDKYRMSLIEKRIDVHQQALNVVNLIYKAAVSNIDFDSSFEKAVLFWENNNLFMQKTARVLFYEFVNESRNFVVEHLEPNDKRRDKFLANYEKIQQELTESLDMPFLKPIMHV